MHDKFLLRVCVLFLVILAVIVGTAVHALRALNRSVVSNDWVNQTHATIYQLENVLSTLRQADSLMRTYALTGDAADRRASREAFSRMHQHFDTVTALTRDDAAAQTTLRQLRAQAEAREAFAESIETARAANRATQVQSLLATDAGGAAVAAIERGVATLRDAQFALLSERDHESYLQAQSTRWVVGLGIGVNLLLLAIVGWLLRTELALRRKVAATLADANAQLEVRVRERTAELTQSNQALRAENLARKWANASQEHQVRYNHLIVNAVNDLVFVVTKALTVTRINPAVVNLTARPDEEILTGPLAQVVRVAADPGTDLDPLARALQEGREIHQLPVTVLARHDRTLPGQLTLLPLRDQDKVVGAIVVVQVIPTSVSPDPVTA